MQNKPTGVYKLTISTSGDRNGTLLVEPVRDSRGVLCGHKFRYSEGKGSFHTDGFMTDTKRDKAPELLSKCLLKVKTVQEMKEKGLKYCLSCQGSGISMEVSDIGKPRKLCSKCNGTGMVPLVPGAKEDPMVIIYKKDNEKDE